jgi:uncharacterized protein DUF6984
MLTEQQFRTPTSGERDIFRRLLSADFPGRPEILLQLENCRVRIIDDEGSLEITPGETAPPATIRKRIPVEAEAADKDGIYVHFLLHVANGFVNELDVYKDDGSPIQRMPSPDEMEVIVLPA